MFFRRPCASVQAPPLCAPGCGRPHHRLAVKKQRQVPDLTDLIICMLPAPYPKARIPTDPILSMASFGREKGPRIRSVLDTAHVRHVTSGRMATGLALQQMQVGPHDDVLMPAYHSRSMVEPVIWQGARPVFYQLHADTRINLEDIAARLSARTRVLVVVNYFGFPQDLLHIRRFCDAHSLLLLEDCAHAFMGECAGRPLGSFGDYAIASTMKLFPVVDGGCLVSAYHRLDTVSLISAGPRFELKMALNTLQRAFAYGRLPVLSRLLALPMRCTDWLWQRIKAADTGTGAIGPKASDGAFGFEAPWLDKRASLVSRLLLRGVSMTRAATARRANYLRLHAALADLPGCAPLYRQLPAGVCPWVFPLVVDAPATVFPLLKQAGVPVVRFAEHLWDGVDETVCPVSVALSRQVMQLPCHQALLAREIDWMIAQIRTAVYAGLCMPVPA